jgi:hypothetical protein
VKKYETATMVVAKSSEEFLNKLDAKITVIQEKGLQAEIQYQPLSTQLTALVLGWREIK